MEVFTLQEIHLKKENQRKTSITRVYVKKKKKNDFIYSKRSSSKLNDQDGNKYTYFKFLCT